jgi:hypothetical protein
MYYIAEDQTYLNHEAAIERRLKCQKIMNGTGSFMKYLKSGGSRTA